MVEVALHGARDKFGSKVVTFSGRLDGSYKLSSFISSLILLATTLPSHICGGQYLMQSMLMGGVGEENERKVE